MRIKTLEELRQPDDRTLMFTPLGLGGPMPSEEAAKYQQQVVAQFELSPMVAQGTRSSFEDLRTAFAHGLFCYENFTLVNDRGLLVLEQALRDRFIEHHNGTVTFVNKKDGSHHTVAATNYEQLYAAIKKNRHWHLLLEDGQPLPFNGMLGGLRSWARRLELLRGQRNRAVEQAITNLRDLVAHPTGHHLATPVDAARTLRDLAEIINHLWGAPTPGGRLYPAPIKREVVALAWDEGETQVHVGLASDLAGDQPPDKPWRCVIVRAVFRPDQCIADPGLTEFDSLHDTTQYPADLLWGPGTITDAAVWFAENLPESDEVDYLDRTFAIRQHGSDLYLPMRHSIAAALPDSEQSGTWYLIKADHPNDAYHHVRMLLTDPRCAPHGPCTQCHAETLGVGRHEDIVATTPTQPTRLPTDTATPWAHPRARTIT
ncbi:hypothetical protein [Amycolatopsis sp. WQ 127309]|uniref:hypothetical protein n=1 Tax=Amycolatopsis sp. WQ 127309 TaxID=2932773 RepID=UPI001FF588D0|nr:hypothetical protein [Amycolatopsis sp. WQ 127309]UOZ05683.1 hypothetical protein MUY22_43800 [Amycolatopsis sp. WQ 127309]